MIPIRYPPGRNIKKQTKSSLSFYERFPTKLALTPYIYIPFVVGI